MCLHKLIGFSLQKLGNLDFGIYGFPRNFKGNSLPTNRKIDFFVGRSDPIALKLSQSIELTSRASVYNMKPIGAL